MLYLAEHGEKEETQLRACVTILEWAYGKPGAQEHGQAESGGAELLRLLSVPRPAESPQLGHEPSEKDSQAALEAGGTGQGQAIAG